MDSEINFKITQKRQVQKRKIQNLSQAQLATEIINCNHKFHPRVLNPTNINFHTTEIEFLNKGLNYNFLDNRKNYFLSESLHAEAVIKTLPSEEIKNTTRVIIHKKGKQILKIPIPVTKKINNFKSERATATNILNKPEDNKALITKADKGNS